MNHWRGTRSTSLVLIAWLLAGCSGGGDEAAPSEESAEESSGMEAADGEFAGAAGSASPGAGGGDEAASPASAAEPGRDPLEPLAITAGRRVIRSAELVLEVDDPASAAERVVTIAERAGGFVAETDLERDRDDVVRGSITLRVPSGVLNDTVDELDALGDAVPVRRIEETDVTAETTDLEAQRENLLAYEGELRELLADVRETSGGADELLSVFERIRQVRAEIDRIEARLAVLTDQVALSTIDVHLRPSGPGALVGDGTWRPAETVQRALHATGRTLTGIANGAIWIVLTGLPVAVVVASPLLVGIVLWRRHRTLSRNGSSAGTTAPSSSA